MVSSSQLSPSHARWGSSLDLPARVEPNNFHPLGLASSSSVSLQPPGIPARPSSAGSTSPGRSRTTPVPDIFSVWGKLSSNASAAFSVVQDAYDGVTKDFKSLSTSSGSSDSELKTAELRSRNSLGSWGDEEPSSRAAHTSTIGSSSNPWASVKSSRTLTSVPFDNPWNTVKSPSTRQDSPIQESFESPSKFPLDPTIERPSPGRGDSYRSPPSIPLSETFTNELSLGLTPASPKVVDTSSSSTSPLPQQPPSSNTDPLGVGLL